MVAHVGDFGLARIILEEVNQLSFNETMSLALKGSTGYIPPEYGTSSKISMEGDIFSYGILLLEMMIGKRPTDKIFDDDMGIRAFTTMALPQSALDIVDPSLLYEEIRPHKEENEDKTQETAIMDEEDRRKVVPIWMEECLISVMKISLSCSSLIPRERTSMDVVNKLQAIRSSYLKFKKAN